MHRDIKCANILIDSNAKIKISDFGAARWVEGNVDGGFDHQECKSWKGTPFFLAPELVTRERHSYPADIWSIGCIALEMLCKRPPWSDITTKPKRVMELIGSTDQYPNYPSGISQECYDFIFNACL